MSLYRETLDRLKQNKGLNPTTEEIVHEMGIKKWKLENTLAALTAQDVSSLDAAPDWVNFHRGGLTPEEEYIKKETNIDWITKLGDALAELKKKDRTILSLRYGFFGRVLSQREVGELMEISHTRVGQLEKEALKQLRAALTA